MESISHASAVPQPRKRKQRPVLLRLSPELVDERNRWAKDEIRSLNAQVDYILRKAVRRRRRLLEPPSDSEAKEE